MSKNVQLRLEELNRRTLLAGTVSLLAMPSVLACRSGQTRENWRVMLWRI